MAEWWQGIFAPHQVVTVALDTASPEARVRLLADMAEVERQAAAIAAPSAGVAATDGSGRGHTPSPSAG